MSASATGIATELESLLGAENVSTDELDLICYARDMAPMPDELLKSYGMIPPTAVARPGTAEEVASVLKWAGEGRIPLTPRAGGSWALGGTIPIEGGVVLDLGRMDRIIEINEADRWVRVEGSVTWKKLSDTLARKGLRVGTYPSSAPAATVAGFIATGGSGGIGASLHGPVGDQVLSLKVALTPDASGLTRVIETDPWSSWLFVGSEGTLGVICEAVLKVFPLEPMYHAMLSFDDPQSGWEAFRRLYEMKPYFLTCIDKGFAEALNECKETAGEGESGGHSTGHGAGGGEAQHKIPEKKLAFVACFIGSKKELAKVKAEVEGSWKNALADEAVALHEWETRFDAVLSTKKLGPTIFSPEIQVPMSDLPEAFAELEHAMRKRRHAIEGMAIGGDAITILPVIYTDERQLGGFLKVFSYTRPIVDIGYNHGGSVYGLGLHNSAHAKKIHGRGWKVMRKIRAELEPTRVLNPSKTTQIRVRYILLRMAMFFMGIMPRTVALGLTIASHIPRPLLRLGLKLVRSEMR